MNITLSTSGELAIHFSTISLEHVWPVVNGIPLTDCRVEVVENTFDTAQAARVRYVAPALHGGAFRLDIRCEPAQARCWLESSVEGLPPDVALESFGLRFEGLTGCRAFLRSGYHSWDGADYVDLAEMESGVTGYAVTQLLPDTGPGSVVCGFDRHDRFQQTFTVTRLDRHASLTVLTHWDHKQASLCAAERLVLFERPGVEEALREWARLVAETAPLPPRALPDRITGWCSWYNLYASITEQNILEHLRGAAAVRDRESLPLRVFQIDDGFTPEMGDWLDVRPAFPRGMKPLLDDIRAAGFVPGLWIAPFVVGNRSRLYHDHPDWVVQDRATGGPLVQMRFYGEFRWHKRSEEYYILDATHPDALAYLREVFRTWRHDWGCAYFKTDFMFFGSDYGPDRARWHMTGQTRVEIWRRVAVMIREEIGDAIWLGCGCPLWASVGLVDAVRIGRDVGVKWAGDQSAQSLLKALMMRSFAHTILWQADPDCLLLRDRFHHLSDSEIRALALYAGLSGGVLMTSDSLHDLSAERLDLFKTLLDTGAGACRYPLLGQSGADNRPDPVVVQVRDRASGTDVHVFNTGEDTVQRSYALRDLGIASPARLRDGLSGAVVAEAAESIQVTLAPHASVWFRL